MDEGLSFSLMIKGKLWTRDFLSSWMKKHVYGRETFFPLEDDYG